MWQWPSAGRAHRLPEPNQYTTETNRATPRSSVVSPFLKQPHAGMGTIQCTVPRRVACEALALIRIDTEYPLIMVYNKRAKRLQRAHNKSRPIGHVVCVRNLRSIHDSRQTIILRPSASKK